MFIKYLSRRDQPCDVQEDVLDSLAKNADAECHGGVRQFTAQRAKARKGSPKADACAARPMRILTPEHVWANDATDTRRGKPLGRMNIRA